MDIVKYTETIFSSSNKKGVIKPDEEGYYTIPLGALNTYNSAGEYYVAEEAIKLFDSSSSLMRRIKNGALYAELGHPKKDNMSTEAFYRRMGYVDERCICGHIAEVSIDFNYGKNHPEINNSELILILGKVRPAGPHAESLKMSLESSKQNSAFSVRGITENIPRNNRMERILTNIITWDYVVEPGINVACKAKAPGLESHNDVDQFVNKVLTDMTLNKDLLIKVLKNDIQTVASESTREIYSDILHTLNRHSVSRLSNW